MQKLTHKLSLSFSCLGLWGSLGPWSSLVEGDEGLHQTKCQNFLVIVLYEQSLLYATAYHLDRYEPLSPSTKELHA